MSFFSRLTSKSKDSRPSAKVGSSAATPNEDLLPLQLPSSSLLTDASLANPLLLSTPTRNRHGEDSDLQSLRTVETSPWVDVGETPRTLRILDGKGKRLKVPELVDPVKEKKERVRLEKARLGVAEMTLLMEECGSVIKQRGLTTLGLFRPFRAAENLSAQRKLCLLFLDYMAEFDIAPSSPDSIRSSEASKAVLLHAFKEELRYANVHDVAAVLRWGLRHFVSKPSFSGSPTPSIDWYASFLRRSSSFSPSHPPHSFSAFLLPSLPPPSQALLLSTLMLLQAVVANAQHNAMTARRLCRTLGIHLFGMSPPAGSSSFDDLYSAWREAGDALEGCLKAFLREQTDLPPRLQELVDDYPMWVASKMSGASSKGGRKVRVVKVEVESKGEWRQVGEAEVNDQETGFVANGRGGAEESADKPARRRPVEILLAAIEADPLAGHVEADEAAKLWARIVERAKEASDESAPTAVLEDEVVRVLELLNLDSSASAEDADPFAADGSPRLRAHSLFSDRRASSFGTFSNLSTGNLFVPPASKRTVTPTWNDFKQSGFSTASELDAANEFGLFNPETDGRFTKPARLPRKVVKPEHRVVSVSVCEVDEEFPDAWIDTLGESTSTFAPVAGWPSLVGAPLQPSLVSSPEGGSKRSIDHLVIYERLLPPAQQETRLAAPRPPLALNTSHLGVHRAFSTASILGRRGRKSDVLPPPSVKDESTLSPGRKWRRRASAIFATGAPEPEKSKREGSSDSTASPSLPTTLSTLLPSSRRNRRSLVAAELPPPVTTAATPSEPPEMSPTSPSSIVRTFSRNLISKRSRSSLYSLSRQRSPISEEGEPVPVPPLPAHFAGAAKETDASAPTEDVVDPVAEVVVAEPEAEGYRVESTPSGPAAHVEGATTETLAPASSDEVPQLASSDQVSQQVPQEAAAPAVDITAPLAAEEELREGAHEEAREVHDEAHEGLPVLGAAVVATEEARPEAEQSAVVEPDAVEPAADTLDEAPPAPGTVAAAPSNEPVPALDQNETSPEAEPVVEPTSALDEPVFVNEQPPAARLTESTPERREAELSPGSPAAQAEPQNEPATPVSPIVTLSPPPEDAVEPTRVERPVEASSDAAPLGLGLVNAPIPTAERDSARDIDAPPATPDKSSSAHLASLSAATATSPSTASKTALSPASPTLTNSPTPSTSSTASRKFLNNVGGFLRRNKSAKEQARRDKEEAKREKEEKKALRQLKEAELRKEKRERKNPTPVSNVKARVKEIEEEQAASSSTAHPATPTRSDRPLSSASPLSTGVAMPVALSVASPTPASPTSAAPASASPTAPVAVPAQLFAAPLSSLPSEANAVPDGDSTRGDHAGSVDDVFAASAALSTDREAPARFEAASHVDEEPVDEPPAIQVEAAPEEFEEEEASVGLAAAPLSLPEEHTLVINRDTPTAPPQQEAEHLHVKVPSSLADLPSPIPSPTPVPENDQDGRRLAEDLTEKIPELHPPVFESSPPPPSLAHEAPPAVPEADGLAGVGTSASSSTVVTPELSMSDVEQPQVTRDVHDEVTREDQDDFAQAERPASLIGHDRRPDTPVDRDMGAEGGDALAGAPAAAPHDPSATPNKPSVSLIPPHVVHGSPSQHSLATTTSFETANSVAPSITPQASLDDVRLAES